MRARKRETVRKLLQSPESLASKGLAALRVMRRGSANPTYSLTERALYQDLVEQLEMARDAFWFEERFLRGNGRGNRHLAAPVVVGCD